MYLNILGRAICNKADNEMILILTYIYEQKVFSELSKILLINGL